MTYPETSRRVRLSMMRRTSRGTNSHFLLCQSLAWCPDLQLSVQLRAYLWIRQLPSASLLFFCSFSSKPLHSGHADYYQVNRSQLRISLVSSTALPRTLKCPPWMGREKWMTLEYNFTGKVCLTKPNCYQAMVEPDVTGKKVLLRQTLLLLSHSANPCLKFLFSRWHIKDK